MSHTLTPPALVEAWRVLDTDPAGARQLAEALLPPASASPSGPDDANLLIAAADRRLAQVMRARARLTPQPNRYANSPVFWFEWAMILTESDEWEDAASALRRAVGLHQGFVGAWRALGDQLVLLGEHAQASQAYARAAAAATRAQHLLPAAGALAAGDAAAAERLLKPAVRANPSDMQANQLLAEAAILLGRPAGLPEAVLLHCLEIAPDSAAARHRLATFYYQYGGFKQCIPHLEQLLRVLPHQPCLRVMLAESLVHIGDFAAATPIYGAMTQACPVRRRISLAYAHALKTVGQEAEAADAYRACLPMAGTSTGRVWLSLTDLRTVKVTDADIEGMRASLRNPGETDLAQLNLALGRALDQRGDYAQAFIHYQTGAAQRRATVEYDAGATTAAVVAACATYTRDFFQARAGVGCASDAPILIVGMPRSGSTLVEQILASHPAVEGTAELREIGLIAAELRGQRPRAALPAIVAAMDSAAFAPLGQRYIAETRQYRRTDRPRFTDKMPDNFLHIGLIKLMLPNARIIDVRRNPMATGIAAFRQFFTEGQERQNYTWDLTEIGRYTRDYIALMDHFDTVLPGHVFHLRYETLVEDTETQIRALLDYCGLPFDPACLRYWETDRAVQTPSAQQVRQPIFRDALDEWRNYEDWLGPLREALGDLVS
jgi:tetratricopeptide (TPR) repeat protein